MLRLWIEKTIRKGIDWNPDSCFCQNVKSCGEQRHIFFKKHLEECETNHTHFSPSHFNKRFLAFFSRRFWRSPFFFLCASHFREKGVKNASNQMWRRKDRGGIPKPSQAIWVASPPSPQFSLLRFWACPFHIPAFLFPDALRPLI